VVAVEVRRLAQSAAEASNDVKALIEQSSLEVKGGSNLVLEAAGKLNAMLDGVRSNYELLQNIAVESRAQASSIDEVNTAVRQMDEMTQHNAALVEETNAAIEQTEAQAEELDRVVAIFRTEDADAVRAARPMRRAG
jgi:methyl-accepting chemotaxis protein